MALEHSPNRRADGRRRQFSVGIADRAQLDALAETLDLPRSQVINLALAELAFELETFDDQYVRLFAKCCERFAEWLMATTGLTEDEATESAGLIGQDVFMNRREWREILFGEEPRCIGRGIISAKDLAAGKAPPPGRQVSRRAFVRERFEQDVRSVIDGHRRWLLWRHVERRLQ